MKAPALSPLLLLVSLFFPLTGHSAETQLITVEEARKLVAEGKGQQAASALREVAQKNPDDLYALYNYAIAAYATGHYLEASQAFSEVSGSHNTELRSLALTQMGNAQYRLGEALGKDNKSAGTLVAWERAVDYYKEAIDEKSLKASKHNLEIVSVKYEKLLLVKGDESLKRAQQDDLAGGGDSRARLLSAALDHYEKATEINPHNKETKGKLALAEKLYAESLASLARKHREEAYKSGKLAEEKSKLAEAEPDKKAKGKLQQESRHFRKLENQQRSAANENYEQALDVATENKELQKEYADYKKEQADFELNDAEAYLAEADAINDKNRIKKLTEEEKLVQKALEKIDQALAFDEGNDRGEKMKEETLKRMENLLMEKGKLASEKGAEVAEKNPENARNAFAEAVSSFQNALDINPENQEAKSELEKAEKGLAEAYADIGEKEMAEAAKMAAASTPPSQSPPSSSSPSAAGMPPPGQSPPPGSEQAAAGPPKKGPAPSELQKQIGHLEKAAQSFAQAEALAPGENEAAKKEEAATEKLNELRNELDKKLAEAAGEGEAMAGSPGAPGEPGAPGKPGPPGEAMPGQGMPVPGAQSTIAMGDAPQILSFSEVRGSSENEGQFIDKSKKEFIRDW